MKLFRKNKLIRKLDKDFEEGKIVLPTDLSDYKNIEELKEKCPDNVLFRLAVIEGVKKNGK